MRVTQSDRDLFKHYLISEATDYVAAAAVRTRQQAPCPSRQSPGVSSRVTSSRQQLAAEQYKHVDMARELAEHNGAERRSGSGLSGGQRSPEQRCKPHCVSRKIERYEADLDELRIRLEEQNEVVAEAIERRRKRTRLARKLPNWKWTS
ncbi:hypothetical protein ACNKHL_05390 [Shigella flexneri]